MENFNETLKVFAFILLVMLLIIIAKKPDNGSGNKK